MSFWTKLSLIGLFVFVVYAIWIIVDVQTRRHPGERQRWSR